MIICLNMILRNMKNCDKIFCATTIQQYWRKKNKNDILNWIHTRGKCKNKKIKIIPIAKLSKLYSLFREKQLNHFKIERELGCRIGRRENFPDAISENLVLYALTKKHIECNWITKSGDLKYKSGDSWKKGEVKAKQNGPSQFSPSSSWDTLFFVDARTHIYGEITIYMIENIYEIVSNIQVNSTETLNTQAKNGRRARFDINKKLEKFLTKENTIYKGTVSTLLK